MKNERSNGPGPSLGVAALALAFVAGAAGGLAAGAAVGERNAPSGRDDGELAAVVLRLDDSVRELAVQIEGIERRASLPSPISGGERGSTPAPIVPVGAPELGEVVEQLRQIAALLGKQALGDAGLPGGAAAPRLWIPDTRPPPEVFLDLEHGDEDATLAEHLFWTYQEVLDAYGRPSNVFVNERGIVTLEYEFEGVEVGFRFFQGMVIGYWD